MDRTSLVKRLRVEVKEARDLVGNLVSERDVKKKVEEDFKNQTNVLVPKEKPVSYGERLRIYTDLRHLFEEVRNDFSHIIPFYGLYNDKVDFYFHDLHEKWGLR